METDAAYECTCGLHSSVAKRLTRRSPSSSQPLLASKINRRENEPPRSVCHPTLKLRPRRHERYSGDDRQRGQAERVSAAGSPSLRIGVGWASRRSHHKTIGRIRSRRLARRAANGTHEAWQASVLTKPRKSPVNSVIQSYNLSTPPNRSGLLAQL